MGRKKLPPEKFRQKPLRIRLNPKERRLVDEAAEAEGHRYLVSASDPHPLVPARRSLLGGQRDVEPGKRYLPPPSAAAPG